jgi:uncharacterized small protein (DUF1192 family)
MPWPWEREQERERAPQTVTQRLEEAVTQLDQRIVDLRAEVGRLRALREAEEREGGRPCPSS